MTTILTMQLMLSPKVNGIIVLCTVKVFSVYEKVVLFISIGAFNLDDEQSKGKVNSSNGSTKTLWRT